MHEFIFRIHKIFQQLLLRRMIELVFNLNIIYLSDWGPAKNHASIQRPSQSLQIFQTILQPLVAHPGQRLFGPRATPHLLRHQLNCHNRTSLRRVWFIRHFDVKDTECTVIHILLLYDKFRYVPYMIQYALKGCIWNATKYLKLKKW